MPSPFPGMDPYLEDPAYWSDFHTRFNVKIAESIQVMLPEGYYTEIERHIWLQSPDEGDRTPLGYPDVSLVNRPIRQIPGKRGTKGAATVPTLETVYSSAVRKPGPRYVTIVNAKEHRVVTAIELLSPSNKAKGESREEYLAKRKDYIASGTNVVEIDLLRSGVRMPMGKAPIPSTDYCAWICRADRYPRVQIWAWMVPDNLPILPVPLKPIDGEVSLPLKVCFDQTFDGAGYASRIDYVETESSTKFPKIPRRKSR